MELKIPQLQSRNLMASSRPQIWQSQNNALGGEVPEFQIDSYIQILTLDDWSLSAIHMDREVVLAIGKGPFFIKGASMK